MPRKELSSTTKSVLALLNNAYDLIVFSNRRKEAREVLMALKAFAHNNNFNLPEEKLENLFSVLLDSRTNTLSYLLTDIARTIVKQD